MRSSAAAASARNAAPISSTRSCAISSARRRTSTSRTRPVGTWAWTAKRVHWLALPITAPSGMRIVPSASRVPASSAARGSGSTSASSIGLPVSGETSLRILGRLAAGAGDADRLGRARRARAAEAGELALVLEELLGARRDVAEVDAVPFRELQLVRAGLELGLEQQLLLLERDDLALGADHLAASPRAP